MTTQNSTEDHVHGPDLRARSHEHKHPTNLERAAPDLLEALEEIRRNCETFANADNMAGRLNSIARAAIEATK